MTEYNVGDIVEASRGETVIRGRLRRAAHMAIDGPLYVGDSNRSIQGLVLDNFTVNLIENPAPPVPTEPGIYESDSMPVSSGFEPYHLTLEGSWRVNREPLLDVTHLAPFTRLEPVAETAEKIAVHLDEDGWNNAAGAVRAKFGATE